MSSMRARNTGPTVRLAARAPATISCWWPVRTSTAWHGSASDRRLATQLRPRANNPIEWHKGGVGHALERDTVIARAGGEGGADDHAMADDERGQLACFDIAQGGIDA